MTGEASQDTTPPSYALSSEQALRALDSRESGLSDAQATTRRAQFGLNRLPSAPPKPAWQRFVQQFHNVLIYILLASAVVSLYLQHLVDAGVILGVVLINAIVGFIQEGKAEAALRGILSMTTTQSLVVRDGKSRSLDSQQIVPGDVVMLQAGDRVPADVRLFYCKDLRCDESALTGESEPVDKQTGALDPSTSLAERSNMAYMGSLVTYGVARGVVCHTGTASEIGRISKLVQAAELPQTPLQKQLKRFALQLSLAIALIAIMTLVFGSLVRGYALDEMFQAAIGIAVASIPEGLPAVVTIALAIGVQRMARAKALIRRLPSVEVLGSVDVICSDKTGTLTTNAMTARRLVTRWGSYPVSGEGYAPQGRIQTDTESAGDDNARDRVPLLAMLCNDANVEQIKGHWQVNGDPTEGALTVLGLKSGLNADADLAQWPRVEELPFETEKRYMATLHTTPEQGYLAVIKGAPERVMEFCEFDPAEGGREESYWRTANEQLAEHGMRVIALAQKQVAEKPNLSHDWVANGLQLMGLVGISDPPRKEAVDSIAECHRAGIRVKMITGDNPVTARAIGRELGLDAESVLTGREIDQLDAGALGSAAEHCDVFARTSPANKLQLVEALQRRRHTVAMTGDGVNDSPALKQADLGVAMGHKGTDAAKEAADMVLTDDNFTTIARAVEEGRTVYDNIVKSILFILPTNLAEAAVIIVAIVAGQVLPITAPQILWVNMVTAVTLALALVFEPTEAGTMARPPRPYNQGLFTTSLAMRTLLVGAAAAAAVFVMFRYYYSAEQDLVLARTVAVNTLVMFEAFYLLNCRFMLRSLFNSQFFHGAGPSFAAIGCVLLIQGVFTYWPPAQALFGVTGLRASDWGMIVLVGLPIILVVELEKLLARKRGAVTSVTAH